jgi:hypothetical protein
LGSVADIAPLPNWVSFHWTLVRSRVRGGHGAGDAPIHSIQLKLCERPFSGPARVLYLPFVRLSIGESGRCCPVFDLDFISPDSRPIAGVRGR